MRIDKYLWAIRLFKTRTLSAEACRLGRVRIDDNIVKASRVVKIGDKISINKKGVCFSYEVISLLANRVGAAKVAEHAKDTTPQEELDKLAMINSPSSERRARGSGRPTKRERREIDDFKTA